MNFSDLKIALASKKANFLSEMAPTSLKVCGVIVDSQDVDVINAFLRLQEDLNLSNNHFHLLICSRNIEMKNSDFPVFLPKHISWSGNLGNGRVKEFAGRKYDVLISFTDSENKISAFLVSRICAKLKVGRSDSAKDNRLYDLLIAAKREQPDIYVQEIKKYLKQIIRKTA